MTTIAEIEKAVRALPENEFTTLSTWFENYEEQRWDHQIERDQKAGPLRDLMEKAQADFKAANCSRL